MGKLSPLRRRMIEDMRVRNLSPATQEAYVRAVEKLSRYFGRSPDRLSLEDVRAFQVGSVLRSAAEPRLPARPPYLNDLVPDISVIPPEKLRDLLYREAAHEHVTQLVQLRIRPFPDGVHGRWFVARLRALRTEDRGANQAKERVLFGISRAAEERAHFYVGHLPA